MRQIGNTVVIFTNDEINIEDAIIIASSARLQFYQKTKIWIVTERASISLDSLQKKALSQLRVKMISPDRFYDLFKRTFVRRLIRAVKRRLLKINAETDVVLVFRKVFFTGALLGLPNAQVKKEANYLAHIAVTQKSNLLVRRKDGLDLRCLPGGIKILGQQKAFVLFEQTNPFSGCGYLSFESRSDLAQYLPIYELINKTAELYPRVCELESRYKTNFFDAAHKQLGKTPDEIHALYSNNILITGIPRSGSSLLCRVVDDQENTIIVNEPEFDMFEKLRSNKDEYWLQKYFNAIRSSVITGEKIKNKVKNGKILTDTALENEVSAYRPKFDDESFILGIKDNIDFLTILSKAQSFGNIKAVLVCIRNPIDSINSWSQTFDHLQSVDLEFMGLLKDQNHRFTNQQVVAIDEINETNDISLKRALFWNFLSEIIWQNRQNIILIPYEAWFSRPAINYKQLSSLFGEGDSKLIQSTVTFKLPQRHLSLSDEEIEVITATCMPLYEKILKSTGI